MSISAISKRYAKALAGIGAEQDLVVQYGEELAGVKSVFETEEALRLLMESPSFPSEKKVAMLAELTGEMQLSEGMNKFLGLLLEKDRLKYLPLIEGEYRKLADEFSGILRARIVSAAKLDAKQKTKIQTGLEAQTGKKIELSVSLDKALIGGIQAEIGGKVFDGTVKTQLNRIADTLQKG